MSNERPYGRSYTFHCEYTPIVRVIDDGDGKRLEFREEDETEFKHRLCLSDEDIKVVIKMLQEII